MYVMYSKKFYKYIHIKVNTTIAALAEVIRLYVQKLLESH